MRIFTGYMYVFVAHLSRLKDEHADVQIGRGIAKFRKKREEQNLPKIEIVAGAQNEPIWRKIGITSR